MDLDPPDHEPSTGRSGAPRAMPSLVDSIQRWSRIWISFLVILAVLVVLGVGNDAYFEPRVRRAIDVGRVVRDAHEAMLDQETGLRGYLLSGDDGFLEPYSRGRQRLEGLNNDVQVFAGVPGTADLFREFRRTQSAWVDGWTQAAVDAGAATAPDNVGDREVLLREGQVLFDEYRATYEALLAELIAARDDAVDDQADALRVAIFGAAIITTISGAVTALRSRKLQRSVAPPLDGLLAHLASIQAGDFDPRPAVYGPEELQRIGAGLDETAAALALARDEARAHAAQIVTHSRQLGQVLHLARAVAGSLNLGYVLRGVCDATSAIADGRRVVVWLRSEDESTVEARADSAEPELVPVGLAPIALGEGIVGRSARYGRMETTAGDPTAGPEGKSEELGVPMVVGAEVIGVILVTGPGASTLPTETLEVLEALAVQAASAVSSARLLERSETLAMTDALTHLPNRRQLEADLATEVSVSTRHDRPLAFAMIDVDHFKAYNDTHGHQAADVALQELARVLSSGVRSGDTVYRYGGEELAVIMRETDAHAAHEMAERLRAAIEHHFTAPSQPRAVTVSTGVAAIPQHGNTAKALVAAADGAMYEAKQSGRNRVCTAIVDRLVGHLSRQ